MENFHLLLGPAACSQLRKGFTRDQILPARKRSWTFRQHRTGAHFPQVFDQGLEAGIAKGNPVDVHDRHGKTRGRQQPRQRRCFDPRVGPRDHAAFFPAGFDQAGAQGGQAVAAGHCTDERSVGSKCAMNAFQCQGQFVDRVQRSNGNGEVVPVVAKVEAVLLDLPAAGGSGEHGAGIDDINFLGKCRDLFRPIRRGAADQQATIERPHDVTKSVEALPERAIMEQQFRSDACGTIAPQGPKASIE